MISLALTSSLMVAASGLPLASGLVSNGVVSRAVRIARLERRLLLRRLQRAGIQTLDWEVDTPFDVAIHTSLSRQSRRIRAIGVD